MVRNVHRVHWMACDEHRVKWWIGSNLFSGWRHEDEGKWEANRAALRDYREIEPDEATRSPRPPREGRRPPPSDPSSPAVFGPLGVPRRAGSDDHPSFDEVPF